jgi:hypothetical protein
MDKQQIGRTTVTKSLATLFIVAIFSTSFAQMGGMGFGYSGGGGGTVDSVRAAGSAQNLQGGATGAIPFQTAAGTTSFDASNLTWDNTNKRLGIGTTGPTGLLHLYQNSYGSTPFLRAYDGAYTYQFGGTASLNTNTIHLRGTAGNTELSSSIGNFYIALGGQGLSDAKLFVGSNGKVGIGTTSPTAVLHLKAGTASPNTAPLKFTAGTNLTTPEAGAMEFDGTNLYFTPSATRQTVTLSSDSSLKYNIVDYRDALQKVLAMRPVYFRYKVGSDTTLHVGLIAQELVHVDSSLVDYGVDGEARGVKYFEVIPVLVRAIQEQDARITALEKRNMFFGIFTGIVLVGLVVVVVRKKAD